MVTVKNKEEMIIEERAGKKRKELGYELHVGDVGKRFVKIYEEMEWYIKIVKL